MQIHEFKLKDLQPSQFYISEKKLKAVEGWFNAADLSNFDAIPIKMLDNRPVMTDGHTCVAACREQNIQSPEDLLSRILSEEEYEEKWYRWCSRMQAEIITIKTFTRQRIPDVLAFEQALREEEDF